VLLLVVVVVVVVEVVLVEAGEAAARFMVTRKVRQELVGSLIDGWDGESDSELPVRDSRGCDTGMGRTGVMAGRLVGRSREREFTVTVVGWE
jgi:hypothetical protein